MNDTGVKPIPVYTPPEDGKPRNAVDEKWMKLTRSALHYMERRAKTQKGLHIWRGSWDRSGRS